MPISLSEFSYTMELDTEGVPENDKEDALNVAGQLILAQIKDYLDKQTTPVSGGSYKKGLSKEYRKKKKSMGKPGIANLQLTDAMLNDLEVDATKSTITFKLDNGTQIEKAFNHNTGDTLPQREFLPDDASNGKFKPNVLKEARAAIETFKSDELEDTELEKGLAEEFEKAFLEDVSIEQEDALRDFLKGFL